MNRSFTRWAVLASAAALLACTSIVASAQATFTLTDSNCSDFALGGSPGARTLTCVVSGPPICSINGPTTGTIGSPINLSTTCSPAATPGQYVWTGGNCASTTSSTCQDTQTSAGSVSYTVKGTNANGAGPPSSPAWPVVWSSTPVAPSGCSITGLPSGTQTSPYSYSLGVSCSGGGAPTQWQWSGGSSATTSTINGSITASTTFRVIAGNGGGSAPQVSGTITVGGGGGGGGGGGAISCAGFSKTVVIDENWSGTSFPRKYSQDAGGFGGNDVLIIRFTTGSLTAPGKNGTVTLAEFNSPPSARHATISATPCDFGPGLQPPFSEIGPSNTVRFYYQVGGTPVDYPVLNTNTTYYVNILNVTPSSCQSSPACDMFVDFTKPRGL